jgi:ribosomal protein L11 methyltransferase
VSEILSRYAGGGTSVEPAFELLDEGLAARDSTDRPATDRAYQPGRDPRVVRAAVDGARTALGHLQAFDLRPIGELETRVVHESDWAEAWKSHFPVLRDGERLLIRPTWRRHRRAPGDVVLALDPGMAFGTGLHPTTRLCLQAIEALADRGVVRGARILDVGSGSGILAVAAA